MMDEKWLVEQALAAGFADAAVMDTKDLVFVPSFRPLCAENVCGKYGANYACPPDCGSVEEMRARVLGWRRALVMQTMWDIDDSLDESQTKPAKSRHNRMTCALRETLEEPVLMIGAGIVGYVLIKLDFCMPPIILGLILSDTVESNLSRTLVLSDGSLRIFLTHPIALALLAVAAVSLLSPIILKFWKGRSAKSAEK